MQHAERLVSSRGRLRRSASGGIRYVTHVRGDGGRASFTIRQGNRQLVEHAAGDLPRVSNAEVRKVWKHDREQVPLSVIERFCRASLSPKVSQPTVSVLLERRVAFRAYDWYASRKCLWEEREKTKSN